VLAQSNNDGWKATAPDGAVGERELVDGYANGWLVEPTGAGKMRMELRWTPQRAVWAGFVVSGLFAGAGVVLIAISWRRRRAGVSGTGAASLAAPPESVSPLGELRGAPLPWRTTAIVAAGVTVATFVFARPWIAIVAGVVALVAARVAPARVALYVAVPALLGLSRPLDRPELAWVALSLFVVALALQRSEFKRRE
jgi:arabinofuranan 3-O-arabinosyltransferase